MSDLTANRSALLPFQQQCIRLIRELLSVDGSAFFLLDEDGCHRSTLLSGVDAAVERDYIERFAALDPLHPSRFESTDVAVVSLDARLPLPALRQTRYFHEFMVPNQQRYVVDIFFRQNGRIVAVLGLLRRMESGAFAENELALLRRLQPFLEFLLLRHYLPRRAGWQQQMQEAFALTSREFEVLELVLHGLANQAIATRLNLKLSTVKTHLHHLFNKTGTANRAELLALCLEQRSVVITDRVAANDD
jgi:DNA-binding CsgD family transcriptional regulator